jgi:hypothetical protein
VGNGISATNAPGGTFIDVYRTGYQGYWPVTTAASSSSVPYNPPYQPESAQTVGTTLNPTPAPAWNATSYQIISPGADGIYGVGGEYETANGSSLLTIYPGSTGPPATQNVDRTGERDNITNFTSGPMAP